MRDLKFNEIEAVAGGRGGYQILPQPPVYIDDTIKPIKPIFPGFGVDPIDPIEPPVYITPIDPPVA